MPDQHCPTCGAARTVGCRCLPDHHRAPHGGPATGPDVTETAVLPHIEGPPLVRPYVQAAGQVPTGPVTPPPVDPFGTEVLPPAGYAPQAATPSMNGQMNGPVNGPMAAPMVTPMSGPMPPQAPPAPPGPDADAFATTVLPPVYPAPGPAYGAPRQAPQPSMSQAAMAQPPMPPYGAPGAAPYDGHPDGEPQEGEELGFFPFHEDAPEGPGGRASRRAAGTGPLAGRKGVVAVAGAGLLALTVGLAYAVTPSGAGDDDRRAQPVPSVSLAPAPTDPSTPPSPSAAPSTPESPSASPTRTAKPSPTRTAAPTPVATTAAQPAPSPTPTAPSPTASTPPTATPTPTASFRTLKVGMSGTDVLAMQQKLGVVLCWMDVPESGRFDDDTYDAVRYFQVVQGVQGDKKGEFGPNTKAALDKRTGC